MSTAKLTLSIPAKVLEGAKDYSRRSRQPLSRLVSRYFSVLSQKVEREPSSVTPRVRRVTGLVKSTRREEDLLFEALGSKYR